jgi:hypothetical protein
VKERLTDVDDRSVVFGGGEEIALAFDVPEGPGRGAPAPRARHLRLVQGHGSAHRASGHARTVAFRRHEGIPRSSEAAPADTDALRDYKRKWQTRVLPGTRAPR